MGTVVSLRPKLYSAKLFRADTSFGSFSASGTLCGHIDFTCPFKGSYPILPDEALALIAMLTQARTDVLENSVPEHDPRLIG